MPILPPGTRIGEHVVVRHIGSGRVADVYEVWTPAGERRALKLLRQGLDPKLKAAARLRQEAEAVATIEHVHVVGYFGGGLFEGRLWILVELVGGSDLRRLADAAGGVLPMEWLVRIVCQACEGVAAAHRRNIVHRDLQPENILVTPEGLAKVADFGSAKMESWGVNTTTEQEVSSARYRSPDFVRDHVASAESDVFTIGVVLYELLAGVHPTCPEPLTVMATVMRLLAYVPPPPLESLGRGIPGDLSDLVQRALAPEAKDRPSMRALADGLEGVLQRLLVPRRASAQSLPLSDQDVGSTKTEPAMPAVGPRGTMPMAAAAGGSPRRPTTLPPVPAAVPVTERSPARKPAAVTVAMTEVPAPGDRRTSGIPVVGPAQRPSAAARDAASRSRVSRAVAVGAAVVGVGIAAAAWLLIGQGGRAPAPASARPPAAPAVSSAAPAASSSAPPRAVTTSRKPAHTRAAP